jgi:hypothetical protein
MVVTKDKEVFLLIIIKRSQMQNIKTIRELPTGIELMGYKVVKKSVDLSERNR